MAEGKIESSDFAGWLPVEPGTPFLLQEAARDMEVIAGLIAEHNWLLNELAGR
jgi:hypothetical protein